jgi:glutamate racemase
VTPVGVFDSGVGGLSVLREIRRELPNEDLLYVADSRHAPYGDRDPAFITERSLAIARFLLEQRAKAIVVACNTATGVAVAAVREQTEVPVVGIEPAVKPAAAATKSGVVGVLTTTVTAGSDKFARLVTEHSGHAKVLVQTCPGLVEQVERGEVATAATRALVERYVRPLIDGGADILVLGCTHYPFLMDAIRDAAGPAVTIVDPAVAVARQLRRRLEEKALAEALRQGRVTFFTSGDPAAVESNMRELWPSLARVERLPEEARQP